jgi:hypothetical protein
MSEQEAIITISRLALTAIDAPSGLQALANVALRLSGLHGVEMSLQFGGGTPQFWNGAAQNSWRRAARPPA